MQKSKKESSDQLSNTYKFYFYIFFFKSVERINKKSQMLSPGGNFLCKIWIPSLERPGIMEMILTSVFYIKML